MVHFSFEARYIIRLPPYFMQSYRVIRWALDLDTCVYLRQGRLTDWQGGLALKSNMSHTDKPGQVSHRSLRRYLAVCMTSSVSNLPLLLIFLALSCWDAARGWLRKMGRGVGRSGGMNGDEDLFERIGLY